MTTISLAAPGVRRLGFLGRHWRSVAIAVVLLAIWEILAITVFSGHFVVPPPTAVVATAFDDKLYGSDVLVTLGISWKGWLIGNGAALLLATVCLIVPASESSLMTLGVASYCVPTIAVGPLLLVLYGATGGKVVMSALSVFFVTLVAAVTGLRAASRSQLELVHAYGGGRLAQLRKVRLRASVPILAGGLAISAPAAILGTIIGDYLGGQDGLGVIMLQSQQQLDVDRTWAIALVTTVVCGLAFFVIAFIAKRLGADLDAPLDSHIPRTGPRRAPATAGALWFAKIIATVAFVLLAWTLIVRASGLSSYFVKTPLDVWNYLFSGPTAHGYRHVLFANFGRTLSDAGAGWVAGTIVAVAAAAAMTAFPSAGAAVMPFVIVMRSVPLIAMCPLIGLVIGHGLVGVTVISGMVTFVPSLVTIVEGLRSAPSAALDLTSCYGGGRRAALVKVRFPYASPAIFAAAKISMPGAMLGAVLAEWLITGHGLGHSMAYDVISSNFPDLWASIGVILIASLVLYFAVGAVEGAVRQRVGGA
jgi:sulfonate transport system permease protein